MSFLFFSARHFHTFFGIGIAATYVNVENATNAKNAQSQEYFPKTPSLKGWGGGGPPLGAFN